MHLSKITAALMIVALGSLSLPASAERTSELAGTGSMLSIAASGLPVLSVWIISDIGKDSVKGISRASSISKTAEQQPNWTVTALTAENDGVRAQFTSKDRSQVIEVVLPAAVAKDAKLSLSDDIQMRKLGKSSAVISRGNTPVVVLADPGSNLVHSSKK